MSAPRKPIQRSIDVARAVLNGAKFADAGREVGISQDRARQIMQHALMRAARGREDAPNSRIDPINDLRANKVWWLARLDELQSRASDQPGCRAIRRQPMSASVQCGDMVSTGSDPWDWHRCPAKAKWWRPLREGKKRFACGRHKKKGFDWKPIAADQTGAK